MEANNLIQDSQYIDLGNEVEVLELKIEQMERRLKAYRQQWK